MASIARSVGRYEFDDDSRARDVDRGRSRGRSRGRVIHARASIVDRSISRASRCAETRNHLSGCLASWRPTPLARTHTQTSVVDSRARSDLANSEIGSKIDKHRRNTVPNRDSQTSSTTKARCFAPGHDVALILVNSARSRALLGALARFRGFSRGPPGRSPRPRAPKRAKTCPGGRPDHPRGPRVDERSL